MSVKEKITVEPSPEINNIIEWFENFEDLKFDIIDEFDDITVAEGREWINKSGWEKIANEFDISIDVSVEETEKINWYKAKAVATIPSGRFMEGVGMAKTQEKARDRAVNRAISDMIAAGRVSAEEIANE